MAATPFARVSNTHVDVTTWTTSASYGRTVFEMSGDGFKLGVAAVAVVIASVTTPAKAQAQLRSQSPATVIAGPLTNVGTTVAPNTQPPVREPGMVRVIAQCPAGDILPKGVVPGTPEFDAIVGAQARLQGTISQVQAYATTQSSTFGQLSFGGKNNATVVVSFTGDLQVHADALTKIVEIPNGVVVCAATETANSQVSLANEILAHASGALTGGLLTPATGRPVVAIRADRRDVADDLVATFGTRIQVVLGEFAYPDPTVARKDPFAALAPCRTVPKPSAASKALRWSVPKRLSIHSGGDFTTPVSWTNMSRRTVTYESGDPIVGVVTKVGGNQILARYTGAIAGIGHGAKLRPRAKDAVRAFVSTASCDSSLGYALPPGNYSVHFLFGGFDYSATGGIKVDQYVSNAIPLTITTDPPPPFVRPRNIPRTPITLPGAGNGGPGATLAAFPTTTNSP